MAKAVTGARISSTLLLMGFLCACQTTPHGETLEPVDRRGHRDIEAASELMTTQSQLYSAEPFFQLVEKYSNDNGDIDYDAWKAAPQDLAALDSQVAMLAAISPDNAPKQFPDKSAQRSYWINTYNTLVLHGVLEYWPLESVRDVQISFISRIVPRKGFFYDRKVIVGGRETNLYRLEKEVLRNQKDPRLHFAFNCASSSCPILRPWEWTDEQLDQAGRDFVNTPANVRMEGHTIYLSSIFKWYRKDFPDAILPYLQQFAEPTLQAQLQTAMNDAYRINHVTYDWSVNDADR